MWKLSYFFVDIERNEGRNRKKTKQASFSHEMVVESTKRECSEKKHS